MSADTPGGRSWGRSLLAVAVGFMAGAALSFATDFALGLAGVLPPIVSGAWTSPQLLLAAAYRGGYSIFGCFLAARLAPDRPMRHALVLGWIGLALNLAGTVAIRGRGPAWYPISGVVLALPYAWIGGKWREMQIRNSGREPAGMGSGVTNS
jgi:hypothetical protein